MLRGAGERKKILKIFFAPSKGELPPPSQKDSVLPLAQLRPLISLPGLPHPRAPPALPPPLFQGECGSLSQLLSCSIYHSLSAASLQRIHLIPRPTSRCAERLTEAAGRQQWRGLLSSCFPHRPGTLARTAVFMIY